MEEEYPTASGLGRVITRIKKLKGRDEKILEGFENLCDLARCKCTD